MEITKGIKKKIIVTILILMAILFFSVRGEFSNILTQIISINYLWLIGGIVTIIVFWALESLVFVMIAKKNGKVISHVVAFNMILSTQFFNGITPLSSGGQPIQVYFMNKNNIKATKATNICVQNFTVHQIAFVMLNIFAVVLHFGIQLINGGIVMNHQSYFLLVALMINTMIFLVILSLGYSKRINAGIIDFLIPFLGRLKIIKDVKSKQEGISQFANEYYINSKNILKDKKIFFMTICLSIIKLLVYNSIVYFVVRSMGLVDISFYMCVLMSICVTIVSAVVPSPGASGATEYAFLLFFGVIIGKAYIITMMLIWRFITYYFGLLMGFISTIILEFSLKNKLKDKNTFHSAKVSES